MNEPPSRTGRLATFGYSGLLHALALREFLGSDVDIVVDVRLRAWSSNPAFSAATPRTVEAAGYEYMHLPELGNAEYRTGGMRIANLEAIETVLDLVAAGQTVALMCACADLATCHRLVLAEEAIRRVPSLEVWLVPARPRDVADAMDRALSGAS